MSTETAEPTTETPEVTAPVETTAPVVQTPEATTKEPEAPNDGGLKAAEEAAREFMLKNDMLPEYMRPTGEAQSGPAAKAPEAGSKPSEQEAPKPEEQARPTGGLSPAILRHAELHGVDPAEFGDDVAGLQRTLAILDRRVAEQALRTPPAPGEKKPAEPAKKSLADKLREEGIYSDTLIEAITALEQEKEELKKEFQSQRDQTSNQQADAHYGAIDNELQKLSPELFGAGPFTSLSPALQQERRRMAGLIDRLVEDAIENGEKVPSYPDLVKGAFAARYPGRVAAEGGKQVATEVTKALTQRKGTPTGRPSHQKPPEIVHKGDDKAVDAVTQFMAEHGMLNVV
jgi:hypothetical protein